MDPFALDLERLTMVLRAAAGHPDPVLRQPPEGDFIDLPRLQQTLGQSLGAMGQSTEPEPVAKVRAINNFLGSIVLNYPPRERNVIADALARAGQKVFPPEISKAPTTPAESKVTSMRECGCVDLGRSLSSDQVAEIHEHLSRKPLLVGHVPDRSEGKVANLQSIPADKNYGCYEFLDLWSAPHLIEMALREDILALAQAYLGSVPTLYSFNAFWSLPGRTPHPYSQIFHRDYEDYKSFVYFTLLTPVEAPEDGMHYYVQGSHDINRLEQLLRADDVGTNIDYLAARPFVANMAMRLFSRTATPFGGPAGSSFGADGYGLHRALVPRTRPRLLLWIRYGTFFNEPFYGFVFSQKAPEIAEGILRRFPETPRHRYIFRYFIEQLARAI